MQSQSNSSRPIPKCLGKCLTFDSEEQGREQTAEAHGAQTVVLEEGLGLLEGEPAGFPDGWMGGGAVSKSSETSRLSEKQGTSYSLGLKLTWVRCPRGSLDFLGSWASFAWDVAVLGAQEPRDSSAMTLSSGVAWLLALVSAI